MRVSTLCNLGASSRLAGPVSSTNDVGGLAGVYRTPHICTKVRGIFTHTQPTAPYRGAGAAGGDLCHERVIDLAADQMGLDCIALRRKKIIPPEAMPFRTSLDYTYDSGDFPRNMDMALEAADWAGFDARRADAAGHGRLRGIGIANAIESAGGPHRGPMEEAAEIRFRFWRQRDLADGQPQPRPGA